MFYLFPLLCAMGCFLGGFYGAYDINIQERDYGLKRIIIPEKWQWLFHLKWVEVLRISVVLQAIAWIETILILIVGYTVCIIVSAYVGAVFSLVVLIIHGFIILIVSIYLIVRRHRYGIKRRKCWRCVLKSAFRMTDWLECEVKVLSFERIDKKEAVYKIQYGKIFPKEFEAKAYGKYNPELDSIVKAIYSDLEYPYFKLFVKYQEKQ